MHESFDPEKYGPVFGPLVARDRRRPLTGGASDARARSAFSGLSVADAFKHAQVADADAARCCLAACWLLVDDLDASHTISQSVDTPEGSWWHGVMHRREGDFGNAKYWFRRVGGHPAMEMLTDRFGEWDPFAFVDACQQAVTSSSDLERCLDRQQAEWETLFDWCYAEAIGE